MSSAHLLLGVLVLGGVGTAACRSSNQDSSDAAPRPSALGGGPALRVAEPNHDFGRVTEGDKLFHVFVVTNAGNAPLEIDKVATTCGCTAAVIEQKTVPPGGQTSISVELDTTERLGEQHQSALILSNDSTAGRTRLEIAAEVVARLAFEPSFVRLVGKKGEESTTRAWLTGTLASAAEPRVEVVEGDAAVTAMVVVEPAGDGVRRGLQVTASHTEIGEGEGEVIVATGMEAKPTMRLRFHRKTTGNLTVPEKVYLNPTRSNLKEHTFKVKSLEPDFELYAAKVVEGPFSVSVKKIDSVYQITVTAHSSRDQTGVIAGKLVLVSNDRFEPRKAIRLTLGKPRAGR